MREVTDLICKPGAARAADVLVVEPHEVVDDELAPALEQVGEAELRAARAVEHVVLVDLDHRQPPPVGVERVALAREALLLLEQLLAGGEPLLARENDGEIRRHRKALWHERAPRL